MRRLDDVLRNWKPESNGAKVNDGAPEPNLQPSASEEGACHHCGGAGFVRRDLPVGDPDFGRAVPCVCVEDEDVGERHARLQRYSNLGPLSRLKFENLIRSGRSTDPQDRARFQRCVEQAEAFANDPRGWLVLVGASGCGKTHIAAAVANRCIERGVPALFVVVPDLLDHLRAAYRPDADFTYDELFEQVRHAPVLILDDLGTQNATPWAEEKLFQIINDRFNSRLPTIITTNVMLRKFDDRLRARLGDPDTVQPHADPIATVHVLEQPLPQEWKDLSLVDLPEVREMTFASYDLSDSRSTRDRTMRENAHRQALAFAEQPAGWLVLISGRERDRSHLNAAIANYRRSTGEFPLLVRVSELLEFLRHAMYEEELDYYVAKKNIRDWPLLLLDDLEIGMGSEYARRELFELLHRRYLARLPTVITMPSSLANLLSDPGWGRLAGLMRNAAGFCSDVTVGEAAQEEQAPPARPARRRKSG